MVIGKQMVTFRRKFELILLTEVVKSGWCLAAFKLFPTRCPYLVTWSELVECIDLRWVEGFTEHIRRRHLSTEHSGVVSHRVGGTQEAFVELLQQITEMLRNSTYVQASLQITAGKDTISCSFTQQKYLPSPNTTNLLRKLSKTMQSFIIEKLKG